MKQPRRQRVHRLQARVTALRATLHDLDARIRVIAASPSAIHACGEIERDLDARRPYRWQHFYWQRWRSCVQQCGLPVELRSALRVDLAGVDPLHNLLRMSAVVMPHYRSAVDSANAARLALEQRVAHLQTTVLFRSWRLSRLQARLAIANSQLHRCVAQAERSQHLSRSARDDLSELLAIGVRRAKLQTQCESMAFELERELPHVQQHEQAYAKAAALDERTRRHARSAAASVAASEYCPYCGVSLAESRHLDHIYPVARGGLSTPDNLVWCCGQCNMRKGDKTVLEFIRTHGLALEEVTNRLRSMHKTV